MAAYKKGTDEQAKRLEASGWTYAPSGGWMGPTADNRFDGVFYSADEAVAIAEGLAQRRTPPITYRPAGVP